MSTIATAGSFGSQPTKISEMGDLSFREKRVKPRWTVMQRADDPDIERANRQLKDDIAGGANGVALIFEGAHTAYGFGLPARPETIDQLFNGIDLDGLHIRLENHPHGRILADALIDYVRGRKIDPSRTKLTFSIDPTAVLATTGRLKMSIEALKASLPQSLSGFFSSGIPGIVLEADGRIYHNCGATETQEIGAMLSLANGYLQMVEEDHHHIVYALPHIGFSMSLNQDPAMGLAKMKILRTLWNKLQKRQAVNTPLPAHIHIDTSMRMMSAHGVESNITRTSLAAYAAISGEANSVTILPHSSVFGLPDRDARRIARNSQMIFAYENAPYTANLNEQDIDCRSLTAAAWREYERFEAAGGVMKCLLDGTLAKNIAEARDLRYSNFMKNDGAIIGVTDYALPLSEPSGIYDTQASTFQPEGIEHCQPLHMTRDEVDFNESIKIAPIEAVVNRL